MKKYRLPILMLVIFETVAVTLWLTKDNLFYLFNFSYIGLWRQDIIGNSMKRNKKRLLYN